MFDDLLLFLVVLVAIRGIFPLSLCVCIPISCIQSLLGISIFHEFSVILFRLARDGCRIPLACGGSTISQRRLHQYRRVDSSSLVPCFYSMFYYSWVVSVLSQSAAQVCYRFSYLESCIVSGKLWIVGIIFTDDEFLRFFFGVHFHLVSGTCIDYTVFEVLRYCRLRGWCHSGIWDCLLFPRFLLIFGVFQCFSEELSFVRIKEERR